MTSTNDGKDVRSYQISGQKAKTYYIELYKTLESRLSADSDLEVRTKHLCEAWQRVHSLCLHSASDTHKHLINWIQRHTAQTLLQSEWQKHTEKQKTLEDSIDFFIAECQRATHNRASPAWETLLLQRAQWFKGVLSDPWGNAVLKALLGLPDTTQESQRDEGPTDQEILQWLKEEQGLFFVTRLRQLGTSKGNDIAKVALKLASAVMERVRASTKPVPDGQHPCASSEQEGQPPTFKDILIQQAGFTKTIIELITDIEFVLLYKDRSKCIALAKQTPLNQGSDLVDRLHKRPELYPHEKRLWKNSKDVATLVAQVMIARCMVVPVCADTVRNTLYGCARALARLQPAGRLPASAAALAAPAATSRHLHTLALGVHAHCKNERKPFVCELYIRAITAGMNELERLKVNKDKEADARAAEKVLSSWFTQLGSLLGESARLAYECALTAFSVHPSQHMYERIRTAPTLQPIPAAKDVNEPAADANSEFGSWATDSRSQTNFVKTSETLNIKKTQQHSNVLSTAVLNEGEALGLSPELCQDLIVLLSGPRVKTLSWDMDKDVLVENCRSYMERTHGGTKALSTELKYLNLDPDSFRHLPEEEDEDEGDIYYGIEKGYEHLVEVQDPEEIWEDVPSDLERTESCYSSEGESFNTSSRQKKKSRRLSESTDEAEQDPLSTVIKKSKARPHSNGSSKERAEHSKDRSKDRKKKERHKKETVATRKKNEKSEPAIETEIDPLSLDIDKTVSALPLNDAQPVSGVTIVAARTTNDTNPKKERKKKEKKEKTEKTETKEKKVPKKKPTASSALSRLIGKKVIKMNAINTKQQVRETETDFNNQIFITDSDYDSQKSSITSLHTEGNDPQVLFDGHFDMDEIKSPEKSTALVTENTNALNKNLQTSMQNTNVLHGLKISNSNLYKYPNTSEQARRAVTPTLTKSNDYPTSRCTPYYPRNDVKGDVKLNIKRLLEFRKQRSAIDLQSGRKQASIRPEQYDQNRVENRPRIPSSTPKAISVPNIPKVFMNKQQSEQLNILKKEVDSYFLNKNTNAKSESNIVGSSSLNLSRQQTQTTRPAVRLNNEKSPPPPWDKSIRNVNNTFGSNVEQKVYNTLYPGGPVKVVGNVTSKLAHQSNIQVKQNITKQNAATADSNSLHDFLKDLHRSNNAGVSREDVRLGGRGLSNEAPSTTLSNPPPLTYCAKQIKPHKKVENAPNTFARLNYLHKNKQSESFLKQTTNQIYQNKVQPKVVDSKVVNIINDQILSRSDSTMIRKIEKNTQRKTKSSIECQVTSNTHSADQSVSRSTPILNEDSNKIPVSMPMTPSATVNNDQNELLLLLRQQSKLNQTRPQIRSEVVISKGANATHISKSNAGSMPSVLNLHQRSVDQFLNQVHGSGNQGHPGLLIQSNKNIPVQIENVRLPPRSSSVIKIPEKFKSGNTQQKVTTGKLKDIKVNSKGDIKNNNEPQDWESVMDALLAHKTPSRGPNALDMVLHEPNQDSLPNNSLRDQKIRNVDSSNNIHSNNIVTTNRKEEKVANYDVTAKQNTSVIQQKPRTVLGNTISNEVTLLRKNILPTSNNASSVINNAVSLTNNDNAIRKSNQTVIIKNRGKVQEIHIPLESFKKDLSCNIPLEPCKKDLSCSLPQNRVPSGARKTDLNSDLIQTDTDTSLTDILPNFSDYDLLEELIDDDLRQEIGELLSDEEGFAASNTIKGNKVNIKTLSTDPSQAPETAQSKTNQSRLIKQTIPNIQRDTKLMENQIKPLSNTFENKNVTKNKPVHVMYIQDSRKSQIKVQHNTARNAVKNSPSPVVVQTNVQSSQAQASIMNNGIKNQSQFVTMDLSAPSNNCAPNFLQQPNINSGNQNINNVRPTMTINQNPGNLFVNSAVTHQPIQNVVLIRPEIVYEQYTTVQVQQVSDSITPSSCTFNTSTFVTVPNISIYGAQFAAPVIISDPVTITHSENTSQSTVPVNDIIYSEVPCSTNNTVPEKNSAPSDCRLQDKNVDPSHVQETPMNLHAHSFSEQHTMTSDVINTKCKTEEVKLNASLSNAKNEVLAEIPKKPEQVCSKTFHEATDENKNDDFKIREDRIKTKRTALLNRQTHFVSHSDAIPLTYAPIVTQKKWIHKRNAQTVQNNIVHSIIALGYKPITNVSKNSGDDTNNVTTKNVDQEKDRTIKMLLNKVNPKNELETNKRPQITHRSSKQTFDSYRIIKTEYQDPTSPAINKSNQDPEKNKTIKMLLSKSITNENKSDTIGCSHITSSSKQSPENILLPKKGEKCDDKTNVNLHEKEKEISHSKENNNIVTHAKSQTRLRSSNKSLGNPLISELVIKQKSNASIKFLEDTRKHKKGNKIVDGDRVRLRSSVEPFSKALLEDIKRVKNITKQQEKDDLSQSPPTSSSKQDIECVPKAQNALDILEDTRKHKKGNKIVDGDRVRLRSSVEPFSKALLEDIKCVKNIIKQQEKDDLSQSPPISSSKQDIECVPKAQNALDILEDTRKHKKGNKIVDGDRVRLRSSVEPFSKALLEDIKCVKNIMKQQEKDDLSQSPPISSSKQDIECVPKAQNALDSPGVDKYEVGSQCKQPCKIFKTKVKLKLENVQNVIDNDTIKIPPGQVCDKQNTKKTYDQKVQDLCIKPRFVVEEQLAGSTIVKDDSQVNDLLNSSVKQNANNGPHQQNNVTINQETDVKNKSTDVIQQKECTILNNKTAVNKDKHCMSEPFEQNTAKKDLNAENTILNASDKSEMNSIAPYVNLIPNNISNEPEPDVKRQVPRNEPIIDSANLNTTKKSEQKEFNKSNEFINNSDTSSVSSKDVSKTSRKHRTNFPSKTSRPRQSVQDQKDLIDSLRDKITIKELPRKETDDPLKRFISIKLSNGNSFKATVSGKLHVDIDSLFKDPAIKSVLLNNLPSNSRCILNVQQLTSMDGDNVRTQIVYPDKKNLETINLISDDEEDTEKPTMFQTEFGKYNVQGIDRDSFDMHQGKFSQKCSVTVTRCKTPVKVVPSVLEKLKNIDECVISNFDCKPVNHEFVLPESLKTSNDKALQVIEIDDSSNDSLKIVSDSFSIQEFSLPEKIQMDLQGLKQTLLKDLCVDMAEKEEEKDIPFKDTQTEVILPDVLTKLTDLLCNDIKKSKKSDDKAGTVCKSKAKAHQTCRKNPKRTSLRKKCISSKRLRIDVKKCEELRKQYEELNIIKPCLVSLTRCDIQEELKNLKTILESSYKLIDKPLVDKDEQDSITINTTDSELSPCKLKRSDSYSILNDFDFADSPEKSMQWIRTKMSKNSERDRICHSEWCMTKLEFHYLTKETYLIHAKLNSDDISTDCESDLDTSLTEAPFDESENLVCNESQVYQVPSLLNLTLKCLEPVYIKTNVYQAPSLLKLTLNFLESTVLKKPTLNLKRKLSKTENTSVDSKISKFDNLLQFSKESQCSFSGQDNDHTMWNTRNSKINNKINVSTLMDLEQDLELKDHNITHDVNKKDTVSDQQDDARKEVLEFYLDVKAEAGINMLKELKSITEEYSKASNMEHMAQVTMQYTNVTSSADRAEVDAKVVKQPDTEKVPETQFNSYIDRKTASDQTYLDIHRPESNDKSQQQVEVIALERNIVKKTVSGHQDIPTNAVLFPMCINDTTQTDILYKEINKATEKELEINKSLDEHQDIPGNLNLNLLGLEDMTKADVKIFEQVDTVTVTYLSGEEQTDVDIKEIEVAKGKLFEMDNSVLNDVSSKTVLGNLNLDARLTEETSKILVDAQADTVDKTMSDSPCFDFKSKSDSNIQLDSAKENNLHSKQVIVNETMDYLCSEYVTETGGNILKQRVKAEETSCTNESFGEQQLQNFTFNSLVQSDEYRKQIDVADEQTDKLNDSIVVPNVLLSKKQAQVDKSSTLRDINIEKQLDSEHMKTSFAVDAEHVVSETVSEIKAPLEKEMDVSIILQLDPSKTSEVNDSTGVSILEQVNPVQSSEIFNCDAINMVKYQDFAKKSEVNEYEYHTEMSMKEQLDTRKICEINESAEISILGQIDSAKTSDDSAEINMLQQIDSAKTSKINNPAEICMLEQLDSETMSEINDSAEIYMFEKLDLAKTSGINDAAEVDSAKKYELKESAEINMTALRDLPKTSEINDPAEICMSQELDSAKISEANYTVEVTSVYDSDTINMVKQLDSTKTSEDCHSVDVHKSEQLCSPEASRSTVINMLEQLDLDKTSEIKDFAEVRKKQLDSEKIIEINNSADIDMIEHLDSAKTSKNNYLVEGNNCADTDMIEILDTAKTQQKSQVTDSAAIKILEKLNTDISDIHESMDAPQVLSISDTAVVSEPLYVNSQTEALPNTLNQQDSSKTPHVYESHGVPQIISSESILEYSYLHDKVGGKINNIHDPEDTEYVIIDNVQQDIQDQKVSKSLKWNMEMEHSRNEVVESKEIDEDSLHHVDSETQFEFEKENEQYDKNSKHQNENNTAVKSLVNIVKETIMKINGRYEKNLSLVNTTENTIINKNNEPDKVHKDEDTQDVSSNNSVVQQKISISKADTVATESKIMHVYDTSKDPEMHNTMIDTNHFAKQQKHKTTAENISHASNTDISIIHSNVVPIGIHSEFLNITDEEVKTKQETNCTNKSIKHIDATAKLCTVENNNIQSQSSENHAVYEQENINNVLKVNDKQNNISSEIHIIDNVVGNSGENIINSSKGEAIRNEAIVETVSEVVDTPIPKNITLMYEGDSRVVLKGSIVEDAVVGTCYVFPIVNSEILSSVMHKKDHIGNIKGWNEYIDENQMLTLSECSKLTEDKDLIVTKSKTTYSNTNLIAPRRGLKRKTESVDSRIVQKKYRKGKNIDYPKITAAAMSNYAYSKEFQKLSNYCSSIKFSYAKDYHLMQLGDIHTMLEDWPIKEMPLQIDNMVMDTECNLFIDNAYTKLSDPTSQTLADEISATYKDREEYLDEINETNFSMGFGEWSGRVNQNFGNGRESTKFMAATLSDVKQFQPFSLSKDTVRDTYESLTSRQDQLQKMERFYSYIKLRDKVRSFFQETASQLNYNWIENKQKFAKQSFDGNTFSSNDSVFDLHCFEFFEPFVTETIVQVVQVGQLPVSAAAQNPVTCDPRVTQVTDADLPQCSMENGSPDDMEAAIKTEYTELTTADISLPVMPDYDNHRTLISATQVSNLPLSNDNITIETEVKIEVLDEVPENIDENNCYDNKDFPSLTSDQIANSEYTFDASDINSQIKTEPDLKIIIEPADSNMEEDQTSESFQPQYELQQNGSVERPTDQLAHAMTAAGILTSPESASDDTAIDLSNSVSRSGETEESTFQTSNISAMTFQHALSKVVPQHLNQTSESDQSPQVSVAPQILHFVHGKNTSINQITLADNTQQSLVNTHPTPVFHIVQSKNSPTTSTSNESSANNSNAYGSLSLVDASLSQGNNQLLHIVNTGAPKTNNATQVLKRVNLLTNVTNAQGANEQKMVQLVCKSTDGKGIQLNTQQRSMVLRLHPIEPTQAQSSKSEPQESNISNTESTVKDPGFSTQQQVELKSRSVYEENYAQFIQNCNKQAVEPLSLPKFNQAFIGKPVFQEKSNEGVHLTPAEGQANSNACQSNGNPFENNQQIANSVLLRKQSSQTPQPQQHLVQQIKQAITPMNIQTMHGSVIYTRQIPVNIGGGQTINLITVPNTERVDDSTQKQKTDSNFGTRGEVEQSFIKIVPQSPVSSNAEISPDETNNTPGVSNENAQNSQAPPILTQMRIKLPMLSKNTQMVTGARVVRPSFFQIQRNVIGGANQPVYQQLVLTAAPTLGPHSIRLPQMQPTQEIKDDSENQTSPDSEMSSSTLREQLREFDMVLEQVKERSTTVQPNGTSGHELNNPPSDTSDNPTSSTSAETTQQILYSIGNNQQVNMGYVNRKSTVVSTPVTTSFARSPDSTNIVESPTSSSHVPNTQVSRPVPSETPNESQPSQNIHKPAKSKSKSRSKTHHSSTHFKFNHVPPKPSNQKPMEDEQTTQRILYILAEYKEQVENSPDKDKPAPRRRTNLQASSSSSSGGSKRKKSSSGSRRNGRDSSPIDDNCRTMGSEDSSCGTSQGDCNESCADTHSPQGSPRKVAKKLSFDQDSPTTQPRPQPQRNVLVTDGPTIAVTRAAPGKPATAVLMPANYILPVSMVKSGQQIAIVTNRGPKILTVGGGEGGATNALLLQRLIGPGLKPMLARPGIRHVRLPTAALQNLQAFHLNAASAPQPEATSAQSPAPESSPPQLVDTKAPQSPWSAPEQEEVKPERESSPEELEQEQEPWNVPQDYSYEETVRTEMDRTVLDAIPDRYSPDMEAERIFDKMFDVESKKDYIVESQDSPRCPYDIDTSDCDDKVVQRRDGVSNRHRLVTAASLRQKFALMEDELRLQKSLSEECEDLGVDSPSASDLFPEAELLFSSSPAHEAHHQPHTPQPVILNQNSISPPDMEDQVATDQLISDSQPEEQRAEDIDLGLEDVGIVTVSEDGMRATISLDHEEFVRSHPNTTFHSELTDEGEAQAVTIDDLKARHLTSTIFHAGRAPATVLVSTPQTTVISQATPDGVGVDHVRCSHADNLNLPSTPKDDGLSRFDSILNESRELHLSNSSAIIHSTGNTTQVIRRVGYEDRRDSDARYLLEDPDSMMAGSDSKMTDDSRETMDSSGEVDDDRSSPERSAELFWEMHARRSDGRRLDFSSDSDKCCKSPYDENNSTDSSGIGTHLRLDSVIKDARGIDRRDAAVDDVPPLRTYPPKRSQHESERSHSGKKVDERCPNAEGKRRASNRGVVKRGCHCCNGSPPPSKSKKPRHKKPNMDFN